jgi:hypothetical protein
VVRRATESWFQLVGEDHEVAPGGLIDEGHRGRQDSAAVGQLTEPARDLARPLPVEERRGATLDAQVSPDGGVAEVDEAIDPYLEADEQLTAVRAFLVVHVATRFSERHARIEREVDRRLARTVPAVAVTIVAHDRLDLERLVAG